MGPTKNLDFLDVFAKNRSQESLRKNVLIRPIMGIPGKWNLDGYSNQSLTTVSILECSIQNILSMNRDRDEVVIFQVEDEGLVTDVISGFSRQIELLGEFDGSEKEVEFSMTRTVHQSERVMEISDACWSELTGTVYALEPRRHLIHCLQFRSSCVGDGDLTRTIEISKRIKLDELCKIYVIPKLSAAPEIHDPSILICSPKSSSVYLIERRTGKIRNFAGIPGRSGAARPGKVATETTLREPTALFFDTETERLLIADSGNATIYYVDSGSIINVACKMQESAYFRSLIIYRLAKFVDLLQLQLIKGAGDNEWGEMAATLFVATALPLRSPNLAAGMEAGTIYKALLHNNEAAGTNRGKVQRIPDSNIITNIDQLHTLQDGSLMISRRDGSAYHLANSLVQTESTTHDEHLS